jgi:2-C-methyl-D-erythritol 4-phosphate cytidylyltransferase
VALTTLRGVPLVLRVVNALVRSGCVDRITVLAPPGLCEAVTAQVAPARQPIPVEVLPQPEPGWVRAVERVCSRSDLGPDDVVVLHDPLHPLAPAELVRMVVDAVLKGPDAVAGVPVRAVTDTLKWVAEDDTVVETTDRQGYRMVYTPQAFRVSDLVRALHAAAPEELTQTAPETLPRLVRAGGEVSMVPAPGEVFRISDEQDFTLVEAMLQVGADVDEEARPK